MHMVSFSNGEVLDIDSPDGAYTYVCYVLVNLGVAGSVLSCMETLKPEKYPKRMKWLLSSILRNRHEPLAPHIVGALQELLDYPTDEELKNALPHPSNPTEQGIDHENERKV